jgi:signal transduction histidine kinase
MSESPTLTRWQMPRLDGNDRWVGGVAAAVATEVGVQPIVIRACFVVLATVGGWGLVLYAIGWAILAIANPSQQAEYRPLAKAQTPAHRNAAIGMIMLGLVLFLLRATPAIFSGVVWPVGFIMTGMLIAWTRSDEGGNTAVVRVVAGLGFAIGGFLAFAALQVSFADAIVSLVFGLAIVGGIILVAAPSVVRMGRDLDNERQERIRSDERARISAHIHDSVLQTLTLIQQHGEDPARTRQLARRQERELRNWLYGTASDTPTGLRLGPALEFAASTVEDRFDVSIAVVAVGDTDDLAPADLDALIAASREAMSNAAQHSGALRIDVYAERRDGIAEVFVRDTGQGFDLESINTDRHGVANSILDRMERAGGTAAIHSEVGHGTEVELTLPIPEGPLTELEARQ